FRKSFCIMAMICGEQFIRSETKSSFILSFATLLEFLFSVRNDHISALLTFCEIWQTILFWPEWRERELPPPADGGRYCGILPLPESVFPTEVLPDLWRSQSARRPALCQSDPQPVCLPHRPRTSCLLCGSCPDAGG